MKVYLDACVLSRLTDDQSQSRISVEAEATEEILRRIEAGDLGWVASTLLQFELSRSPDHERRQEASDLMSFATEVYAPSSACVDRARYLEMLGYGGLDALHLSCAEDARSDIFLTTDDRLIRRAQKGIGDLTIDVMNPVEFLQRATR